MAEGNDFGLEILIGKVLKTLHIPAEITNGNLYLLSKDFYVKVLFHNGEFSIEADPEQNKTVKSFPYESGLEGFVQAEKQKEGGEKKEFTGFVPIQEFAELMFGKIGLRTLEPQTEFSEETMYKIYR